MLDLPRYLADGQAVEIFVHPERGVDLASEHFELKPNAHLLVKVPVARR